MSTFLSLVQDLARESGGASRSLTTVTGATGRDAALVAWIRTAWTLIQNLHNGNWSFMRSTFSGNVGVGVNSYADSAFTITRFGEWIGDYGRFRPTTIYDPAVGRTDENALRQIGWEVWRQRWDLGAPPQNRPTEYAIAPDDTIRLGATPDKTYTLRGEYQKTPQILVADADVPDMPARFHDIIVWRAIKLMADKDEAINALQLADDKYREQLSNMEHALLPSFNARATAPMA